MLGNEAGRPIADGSQDHFASATQESGSLDGIEDRVLELFAADAVVTLGNPPVSYHGREQIREALRRVLTANGADSRSVKTNDAGQVLTLSSPQTSAVLDENGMTGMVAKTARGKQRIPWHFALLGGLLAGVLPALATFLGIAFDLFPSLKPEAPPDVRSVAITDVGLGERDKDLGDGQVADAFFFEVETAGYDADNIAVDWLAFDAQTHLRLSDTKTPTPWGVIDIETRSDRVVGEINVPPPGNHTGCVIVRVLLLPESVAKQAAAPNDPRLWLDVADAAPYDPYDPQNPSCPDVRTTATSSARTSGPAA